MGQPPDLMYWLCTVEPTSQPFRAKYKLVQRLSSLALSTNSRPSGTHTTLDPLAPLEATHRLEIPMGASPPPDRLIPFRISASKTPFVAGLARASKAPTYSSANAQDILAGRTAHQNFLPSRLLNVA